MKRRGEGRQAGGCGEPCPDLAELARLLNEACGPQDECTLAAHLEQCAGCRRRLEQLAGDTPAPGHFRATPHLGVPQEEPLRRAIELLKAEVRASGKAEAGPGPDEELRLDFLAPPDRPGLLGRLGWYEVAEVIGRGGMGIVLKAFDPGLNRFVAIKVLSPYLATSAAARQRFAREGRAAAAINHEHVIAIHGVNEAAGIPYLVMEYVAGTSLQERLDRSGALPLEEVLRIGMQAASGLAAAHAQGLVHRDIKPANILLESGTDRVKITDFGLARAADDASVTQSGFLAGTPQYMAPEQARGDPLDHRADLFSLGSVLYALCTGRPPFRGRTAMAVLRLLCEEAPRPIREINPAVPAWLADVIAVLHAKDPADRLQSAAEVSDLLCGFLAYVQQPALVLPPAGPSRRQVRRAAGGGRRRPRGTALLLALAAGLLSLALTAGAAWLFVTWPGTGAGTDAPAPLRVGPRADVFLFDGPVLALAYAPRGDVLAAADGRAVCLLDPATGRVRGGLGCHRCRVWSVAFSPDGKAVATAAGDGFDATGEGELCLWDLATHRRRTLSGHEGQVYSVAFSPDGRTLASGGWDQTVRLWDVESGEPRQVFHYHKAAVRSVAFSPDGKTLASGGLDGTVGLWDARAGHLLHVLASPGCFNGGIAFSPDGQTLASADDPVASPGREKDPEAWLPGLVRLWDVASGKLRGVLEGHRGRAYCVAFAPDGGSLVSGGGLDGNFGEVIFWDAATGRRRYTLRDRARPITALAFSPDGRALASGGGGSGEPGEVKLWDVNPPAAGADVSRPPSPGGPPPPGVGLRPAGPEPGQSAPGGAAATPPAQTVAPCPAVPATRPAKGPPAGEIPFTKGFRS